MQIPNSPEDLFAEIAEPTLRSVYPEFGDLSPVQQKLVRLIHTEMVKGELTDLAFSQYIAFVVHIWRSLNTQFAAITAARIEDSSEVDTDWIELSVHYARLDQYLVGLLCALSPIESFTTSQGEPITQYLLSGPDLT